MRRTVYVPGMIVGFVFARRKMFEPYHKLTMTTITIANWVLIVYVMINTYSGLAQDPNRSLQQPNFLIPTIHLITGGTAQLLATYLVIRMWFEKQLPAALKVKNIKRYMRFTLALWLITAALGVTIYAAWYARPARADNLIPPVATLEVGGTPEVGGPCDVEPVGTEDPNATPDVNATPELTVPCVVEPVGTEDPNAALEPISTEEIQAPAETEEADEG